MNLRRNFPLHYVMWARTQEKKPLSGLSSFKRHLFHKKFEKFICYAFFLGWQGSHFCDVALFIGPSNDRSHSVPKCFPMWLQSWVPARFNWPPGNSPAVSTSIQDIYNLRECHYPIASAYALYCHRLGRIKIGNEKRCRPEILHLWWLHLGLPKWVECFAKMARDWVLRVHASFAVDNDMSGVFAPLVICCAVLNGEEIFRWWLNESC